ncbi:MAG TPA: amidase family protein [Rhizomicrobium sp.]|nr:amidase family protein [Rhizomicrobium sp.]
MAFADYDAYDATGLAHLVRRKDVSPLELVDAAIERIERHNPTLNAVVYKAYDEARETAKGKLPDGPFKGVPFLIKDINLPVKNWPMTNGSAYLKGYVSPDDGELTKRYRASGVVLVGKTNTPEFGIPGTTEGRHLGICRNPWNPDHSSGGSSGGAASAVASGMVPMAHGSDGLGSIRIPAAQTGLVGMKPTQNRNPGGPDDRNRAHGFVVDHVLTRSVRDSAAMLDWTGTPEDDARYPPVPKTRPYMEEIQTPPGKLRIAFSTGAPRPEAHPTADVQAVFDATVKLLGELGHTMIEKTKFDVDWKKLYRAQGAVSGAMFAASIDDWTRVLGREPTPEDMETLAWVSYKGSRKLTASQIGEGMQNLRIGCRQVLALWRDFDVLLSPVTLAPPPRIGHLDPVNLDPKEFNRRQSFVFGYTPPFNMTGQPSLSLPLGMSSDGLPIGMMFTSRIADEATLYRIAAQLEEAQPWRDRHAKVWG